MEKELAQRQVTVCGKADSRFGSRAGPMHAANVPCYVDSGTYFLRRLKITCDGVSGQPGMDTNYIVVTILNFVLLTVRGRWKHRIKRAGADKGGTETASATGSLPAARSVGSGIEEGRSERAATRLSIDNWRQG